MTASGIDGNRGLLDAHTLINLGRFAEAVPYLTSALAHDPENAGAWCLLAHAKIEMGDLAGSIEAASRASAIEPDNEWALRLTAICQRRQGHCSKAAKTARRAVAAAPNHAAPRTVLASCLIGTSFGRREATMEAARAVSLAPMDPSTYVCQAHVAIARRQWSLAQNATDRALRLDPTNTGAHQARARLQGKRMVAPTRLADAAGTYADTLRLDPTTQRSRSNLDLTLTIFLSRLGYVLFIETWILFRLPSSASPAARLVPIVCLALPAVFAYRFAARLSPPLRSYLVRHMTRSRVRVPLAFTALSVSLLVATAVVPVAGRAGVLAAALGTALVGRLLLALQVDRYRPGRSETVSTSLVVLIGAALAIAGFLFVAVIGTPGARGAVLVPIALACWIGAGACGYVVWRRRGRPHRR